MSGPRFTELANSLPASVPFVGPETQERAQGSGFVARLGANENVFGPSPKALSAMSAADIWKYGDPESFELKAALAAKHGVLPENIVIGEGIDGLLGYLVRLLIAPGDGVVTTAGAYPTFNYHVTGYGGALHMVPYVEDTESPALLLKKAFDTDAKLIYIANPDNPMASVNSAKAVQEMINNLPENAVLCLDEAYIEFAPEGCAPKIDTSHPRVIRFRTFSKAYGMAGARVGYAITHPDFAKAFDKVRNHFGMNRAAQAGALAALDDAGYLAETLENVAVAKARIADIARANGLVPLPSATNFITVDCGQDADFAKALVAALGTLGVFIRMPFSAPQNRCIRISAGKPADLDLLEKSLPEALRRVAETKTNADTPTNTIG
ncbi:MAG: pyridoxal phosphate-dependent aminotransferase [Rhodobacteraceae bacterium]|nr:pyridoxal phosphate-dependent aminotransferase [Paracoccaceae bacterium]